MFIGGWQWLDWTNIPGLLDWLGFILGGVGIGFALHQLYSSRGALAAAKAALDEARQSLIRDQIIVLLPAFTEISAALTAAMDENSRPIAQQLLQRFNEKANEAQALLENHSTQYGEAIKELSDARVAVMGAIDRLYSAPSQSTAQRVRPALAHVGSVAATLQGVLILIRNEIGSGHAKSS
ncbi:hypothetical protein [Microbacterium esteraromaticum]|uniref:hypothetical protein n=1 Tax=Microbacterium esteraromaticum TaxID=57043 RepID=UPI0019D3B9EA|nr:hypothetical protein [Microbacterium esteraromaticum]MBN7792507.1 hypothetical protein [Microbacterium esteraromaticum]